MVTPGLGMFALLRSISSLPALPTDGAKRILDTCASPAKLLFNAISLWLLHFVGAP